MQNRRAPKFLAGLAAGVAMMVASQTPASAHLVDGWHGRDRGVVWTGHNGVTVADGECDPNRVKIEYQVSTVGGTVTYNVFDPDGCDSGFGARSHHPQRVNRFRVCEVNVNCTRWIRVN